MKQQIFNLIILDESGSMAYVTRQTISGCNETIQTIRAAQKKYADTQEHFISIYAFQRGELPSRYLVKNLPVDQVRDITSDDYRPDGTTPLNDAVGITLTDLKARVRPLKNAVGSVTIITDGEENSSHQYTVKKVYYMIQALKEKGWNFNFIGANIDVVATAHRYCIENTLEFRQDDAGTTSMFKQECCSRMRYYERMDRVHKSWASAPSMSENARCQMMREASDHYFQGEDKDNDSNVSPQNK